MQKAIRPWNNDKESKCFGKTLLSKQITQKCSVCYQNFTPAEKLCGVVCKGLKFWDKVESHNAEQRLNADRHHKTVWCCLQGIKVLRQSGKPQCWTKTQCWQALQVHLLKSVFYHSRPKWVRSQPKGAWPWLDSFDSGAASTERLSAAAFNSIMILFSSDKKLPAKYLPVRTKQTPWV